MAEITEKVRNYNLNITAGRLKTEEYEYRLRLYGRAYWAKELENVVIRSNKSGGVLLLKDIANIKEDWEEDPNWLKYGEQGQNAVSLDVTKTSCRVFSALIFVAIIDKTDKAIVAMTRLRSCVS